MGREQLFQRTLATDTGVDSQKLRNGRLSNTEVETAVNGTNELAALPIYVDDTGTITISEMRAKARRLQAEHGLDLLIVDYLQLISGSGRRNDNRVQEVTEISRQLKALAKELQIPIIALSQLSRAVEGRTSHVPVLADLRESGSIEQDADMVMFIYREEMYDKDTDKKGIAELHIAKHRNGSLGVINLFFDARLTRFRNMAQFSSPEGY
jgi:replicative DNA helicase